MANFLTSVKKKGVHSWRFEVLRAVLMKIQGLRHITLCSLV